MSGKGDSNPRPSAWEADALPTELFPQFMLILRLTKIVNRSFQPNTKSTSELFVSLQWDSNPRPAHYE